MAVSGDKPRTTLRTVRVPTEVADAIERMASEEGITFNSLVTKMMRKFVDFDQFAEKVGFVSLPRETFRAIIESIDDDDLESVSKELGERVPREMILYHHKEQSFQVFLRYLEEISKYYRVGKIELTVDGKSVMAAFHHDMGRGWSVFLEGYLSNAAKRVVGILPACESSEDMVILRFKGVSEDELGEYARVEAIRRA